MADNVNKRTELISLNGGKLHFISEDGELLRSVAIPSGRVRAARYLDLAPPGAKIEVEGLDVYQPPNRMRAQPYGPGFNRSDANPDPVKTSSTPLEREMRAAILKLQERDRSREARVRALERVERIPNAPAPSPAPAPVDPAEGSVVE